MFDDLVQKLKDKETSFLQSKLGTLDPADAPDIEVAANALTNIAVRRLETAVMKYLPQLAAKIPGGADIVAALGLAPAAAVAAPPVPKA